MSKVRNRRRYWCVYLQCLSYLWGHEVAMSKTINVNVGVISHIDPSSIKTSGQYVLLDHLARGLVKSNNEGFLEGDLLEKWEISEDKKFYFFKVKENQKWSTGEIITSHDIINYFKWQIKKGTANHTNLSMISEIKEINSREFSITLNTSHTAFLDSINNADMKLFSIIDDNISFNKSSGAYILESADNHSIQIKKNNFFPYHNKSPERIIFHNTEQRYENIKSLDFVWVLNLPDNEFLKAERELNFKRYSPHLLYTQWFSISPYSKNLKSIKDRELVSFQIRELSNEFIQKNETLKLNSNQLLWEDGVGHIPKNEVLLFWEAQKNKLAKVNKKLELKILAADYDITRYVVSQLIKKGYKIHVDWFSSYAQRMELLDKHEYDLIYQSNDFTENDPYVSLRVTFNPHKPYILTDTNDNQFSDLLDKVHTLEMSQRVPIYKQISKVVLEKAYIAPVSHFKQYYLTRNIDTKFWSNSYPDFRFWKTPVISNDDALKN